MFVVNFDFSQHFFPLKLLAINLPIVFTEIITYPLQRLQTLLISQSRSITNNQIKQSQLILKNMIAIQKFPKLLHGMRYSVDYMGTQMTTKFVLFDYIMDKTMGTIKQDSIWGLVSICYVANAISAIMAQIAYNYQTIASSLPIDKANRPQDVKIKLQNYTRTNKIPINGIKYTLPISLINTTIQLLIIKNIEIFLSQKYTTLSYVVTDLLTAFLVFTATSFTTHYAFQRQVEICMKLPERSIPYSRGLFGSILRYNIKGLMLYGLYIAYFQTKTRRQFQNAFKKKDQTFHQLQTYRVTKNNAI